jgi:hypothetical protein
LIAPPFEAFFSPSCVLRESCLRRAPHRAAPSTRHTCIFAATTGHSKFRPLREDYQRWLTRRIAAERLMKFPESANTVSWLVQAGRLKEAMDVARAHHRASAHAHG